MSIAIGLGISQIFEAAVAFVGSIITPPFTPSFQFNDARNSQYVGMIF